MFAFSAWSDLKEFRQSGSVKYIHCLTGFYATEKKNRASVALKIQTILETPC